MKVFDFWVFWMVVGTALMFFAFSSSGSSSSPDGSFPSQVDTVLVIGTNRKLKENNRNLSTEKKKRDVGKVNLEDYHPIDPVPSSKASINSGPIEHGTPLLPFIPKPTPPSHPRRGGSP